MTETQSSSSSLSQQDWTEKIMSFETYQLKGERQLKQKNYKLANKYFTYAINVFDDGLLNERDYLEQVKELMSHAFTMRGKCLAHFKIYDLAVKDYSKAIVLNKNNATAYENRGLLYKLRTSYMHAADDFTKVIELLPRNGTAYFYRGNVRKCENKNGEALKDYEIALGLPGTPCALLFNNRANMYLSEKNYDLAIDDYSQALKLKPDFFVALRNRGILHKYKGQIQKSIGDFTKAIQLNPKDVTSYNYRAIMYRDDGLFDFAMTDFSKCIELDPQYAAAYKHRSELYKRRNKIVLALRDISHAVQLQPDNDSYEMERFQLVLKIRESCRVKSSMILYKTW
jgi:tetratricopeptide (TPR) repeat protein